MALALGALDAEIDGVQALIRQKERWETRVETRRDERAGAKFGLAGETAAAYRTDQQARGRPAPAVRRSAGSSLLLRRWRRSRSTRCRGWWAPRPSAHSSSDCCRRAPYRMAQGTGRRDSVAPRQARAELVGAA